MDDRLPPHNLETEAAVLGSLLVDYEAIAVVVDWLNPRAFYDARNVVLFEAMRALWRIQRPCDLATLIPLLQSRGRLEEAGGYAYITQLLNAAPAPVYVEHYARIVTGLARQRAKIDAATKSIAGLWKVDADAEDLAGMMRRAEEEFPFPDEAPPSQSDLVVSVRQTAEDIWAGKHVDPVQSTGLLDLDRRMLGGIRPGEVLFVGGRPGSGKTSLAMQIARSIMMRGGKHALFVEREMTPEALLERAIAAEAGVPFATARSVIGDVDQRNRWLYASETVEAWPLVVERRLVSTDQIKARCAKMLAETPVGLVVVDHLDLLSDPDLGKMNKEQQTAETSKRLKAMALDLNIPVVVLAQLNRGPEEVAPFKPAIHHFRNSGSIEQDADYALLLYRRHHYVEHGRLESDAAKDFLPNSNVHRVEMNLVKNRNGAIGLIETGWIPEQMKFVERTAA